MKGESLTSGLTLSNTTHTAAGAYATDAWTFTAPNANYNNTSGTVADSIGKATATCTVTPYTVTYDGNAHTATGTCVGVKGESLTSGLTLSGTTHTAAGAYATDAWTFTAPNANYSNTSGTVADSIGKANPTCTVTGYNVKYNGASHTATGSCVGVKNETLSALNLSGTTHTIIGSYPTDAWTFTASTGNYNNASGTVADSIGKADQTITFVNPGTKYVDAAPFPLGATASSHLAVAYVVNSGPCSVDSSGTLTITGAGNCSVTASQAGDATYNPAPDRTRVFAIVKYDQSITFVNPGTKYVDAAPFLLNATASSHLDVAYVVDSGPCTVDSSTGTLTVTGDGICIVTASQAGNGLYAPAPDVTRIFAILKYDQTITFNKPADVTFGVPPFKLDGTATSGLPITYSALGKCTVSGDMVTVTGVGNCVITATQPGDDHWYPAFPPVIRTFAIGKADQVITFANPGTKTYGDAPFNLGATAPGGPVTYQVTSGTCTVDAAGKLTIHSIGDCTVVASQAGSANYKPAPDVSQTFTVVPATPQIVVTCDPSAVYTGSALTAHCTAILSGPGMADTDITSSIQFKDNVDVGTATASAHWDSDPNYLPADGHTTFQIVTKTAAITVTCSDAVYTGSPITSGCTATAIVDGMDPFSCTQTDAAAGVRIYFTNNTNVTTAGDPAGVTAIWNGSSTVGPGSATTTFAITPAPLTITAKDQTKAVGDTTFDLGHINFTPTGLLGSDHVNTVDLASAGASSGAAKGSYDITADSAVGVGLGNYKIKYANGTLTVTDKYVLTITAVDKTRDYKKANPSFTFNISGYEDGDTDAAVTTTPTCSTTATTASLPGSYHITCTGADASSGKYVFNYVDGTLKITGNVVGGVTGTPATTATRDHQGNSNSIPLFVLLICAAFGGLGLLAVQAQRKSTRA